MAIRNLWKDRVGRGGATMALAAILGIAGTCLEEQRWPNQAEISTLAGIAFGAKDVLEKLSKDEPKSPKVTTKDLRELEKNTDTEERLDIIFGNLEGNYYLIVTQDTWLKPEPIQAIDLPEKQKLNRGGRVDIVGYTLEDSHLKVTLSDYGEPLYVYHSHVKLYDQEGKKVALSLSESVPVIDPDRPSINMPGLGTVFLDAPIIPNGNFTWAEATAGGTRIPSSTKVTQNITQLAKVLQDIRVLVGNRPIKITSWYRPPAINQAVGGAPKSKHLTGEAADFYVIGLSKQQMLEVEHTIESWGLGHGLGIGLGVEKKGFIHVDLGPARKWYY